VLQQALNPRPAESDPAQPCQPISTTSSTIGSNARHLRSCNLRDSTSVRDRRPVSQIRQANSPADRQIWLNAPTQHTEPRIPSPHYMAASSHGSSPAAVAVAGMLRDPTQPNSRIGISRRRPIQAREQPPMQVGSLAGSLPGSLSGIRRILTVGGGWRPCGRKAMHHERRRLDLEDEGELGRAAEQSRYRARR
jgi:hypothetical protein